MAWPDALIAALAALGGAAIGACAVVWATLHGEQRQRDRERRNALSAFYSAAMSFATLAAAWAEMQVEGPLGDLRLGIRMLGLTGTIVNRLWNVTDAFWQASATARSVATSRQREAIDEIESALGEWTFGEPMPDALVPAIQRFRELLEDRPEPD